MGEALPEGTPHRGFAFVRVYVVSEADGATFIPKLVICDRAKVVLSSYDMVLEKVLDSRVRIYTLDMPYALASDPAYFVVGGNLAAHGAEFTFCGGQIYFGPKMTGAILRDNYPRPVDCAPLYGEKHFAIQGREVPLVLSSLIAEREDPSRTRIQIARFPVSDADIPWRAETRNGVAIIDTPGDFSIYTSGDPGAPSRRLARRIVKDARISTVAPSHPRILRIGDRITNRNIQTLLGAKLEALGQSPEFIGTINNRENASDVFITGEGRGGWRASDFIHRWTTRLPVASAASYLALNAENGIDGGRWDRNPFIRPTTDDDPVDRVFNGCTFDFRFYLDRFQFPDPDYVAIGLGTNDINTHSPAASLEMINQAMRAMVPSIREALPSANICWWLPNIPRHPSSDLKWRTKQVPAIRSMINYEIELDDPNFSIVSAWAHMDPVFGWIATAGVAVRNIYDELHPIDANRDAIAELLMAWICSS